jgi:hypothetical protein
MAQKQLHNLKAKAFYLLLKEMKHGMIIISLDCQKNQVLPKVPDQIAYYSRQLYIYNFGTVLNTREKVLDRTTVQQYAWTENN